MNTYVVYHTDQTLDDKQNLVQDVDVLAKNFPSDIIVLNRFKNIKAACVKCNRRGLILIKALGYNVVLNMVDPNAEEKEDQTQESSCDPSKDQGIGRADASEEGQKKVE